MTPRGTHRLILAAGLALAATGCGVVEQIQQLKAFSRCEFRLASVQDTALAGFAIQGKTSLKDFSPLDAFKVQAALRRKELPLAFTLNVEAKNPNDQPAAMNKLAWILLVDGTELTSGLLDRRVEVGANGGVSTVPLTVAVDLRQVLSGKALDSMLTLAFNVAGLGAHPTRITLQAKPTVLVAGQPVEYPGYLSVST
ncbi:MAG: hypothetical protein AAB368_14310, partial [bacterium]